MENIHPIFDQLLSRSEKEERLKQKSKCFWFTGMSGSGKSTVAKGVEKALFKKGYFNQVLDGDNIRSGICNNLTFSIDDRKENIRRIAEVTNLFINAGIVTLNSFVSPTEEIRDLASEIVGKDDFDVIYVKASLELCEERDVKGLYKKARAGEIKNFTGIDSPFEEPKNAALVVDTGALSIEESVELVVNFIEEKISL